MASRAPAYSSRVAEPCRTMSPILVGVAHQVRVLQRGSEVNDIANMAVLAAVDAQEQRRQLRSHQ